MLRATLGRSGTPEAIALVLLGAVMKLERDTKPSARYVLDLYTECLDAVYGDRSGASSDGSTAVAPQSTAEKQHHGGLSPEARLAMTAGGGEFERRYGTGIFGIVTGMERKLSGIENIARIMLIVTMAEGVWNETGDALAFQDLIDVLEGHRKELGAIYRKLYRLSHPDREHFEKVGWAGLATNSKPPRVREPQHERPHSVDHRAGGRARQNACPAHGGRLRREPRKG